MKHFLASLALSTILATPALSEIVPLNMLSQYLTNIGTVETTFTQINSDGTLATGKLYIQRPGRMRFEYDPPNNALVIAGGNQLSIFDPVSDGLPSQYPLRQTPLHLILSREVNLGRSDMVVAHTGDDTATRVLAQDPDRPELGTIELVFSSDPVELRQWVITGADNAATTVILGRLAERDDLSAFLFDITFETNRRTGGSN
jgi:outer membrane lipoprotein-sorting protein